MVIFQGHGPKGVFGKGVGNASEMRQNGSCFIGKRGTSNMRQKSVKIGSSQLAATPPLGWARGTCLDPADPS